jgi:hypothetical protein
MLNQLIQRTLTKVSQMHLMGIFFIDFFAKLIDNTK